MMEVMKIILTFFKSSLHECTATLNVPNLQLATADPRLHWRLLYTHGQAWVSVLWGNCSFLLSPVARKVLSVPSKSLFLQSHISAVIKSHSPPKSNSVGVLSSFARSPGWEICVGPRTFLTVREFLWCNCSAVCGSSARWLHGWVNGDLFQEGLCYMLCDLGLLHPEPLPLQQATADLYLHRRHSNTQRQVWLSLCGVSGYLGAKGFV